MNPIQMNSRPTLPRSRLFSWRGCRAIAGQKPMAKRTPTRFQAA